MATTDDWILDAIKEIKHALNAVLNTAEDLYKRYVPQEQRSRAEQLYKTYAPEIMPRLWRPTRMPDIDVVDLGTEIHLVADLPGVKKEDIDVELTPDIIDICAEPKEKAEKEEQPYAHRERSYAYKRRVYLPASVIPDKSNARFNNGVLEITMPRKEPVEKVRPVKVDVKDID